MKETTREKVSGAVKLTAGTATLIGLGAACFGACEWMKQPYDEAHAQAFDESFASEPGDCLYGTVYDLDQGARVEAFLNTSDVNFSVLPADDSYPELEFYHLGGFKAESDETQTILDQFGCDLFGANTLEPSSSASTS